MIRVFVSQPLALEYHIEKLSDQSCFGDGSLCDGQLQLGIEGVTVCIHTVG